MNILQSPSRQDNSISYHEHLSFSDNPALGGISKLMASSTSFLFPAEKASQPFPGRPGLKAVL